MAGVQISGLLSNSAFDWKSVVDQLVEISGVPIKKLQTEQTENTAKADALTALGTTLTDLQDAVQEMRAEGVFSARTVSSDLSNTTWKCSSVEGAAIGSYTFNVTRVATQAQWRGASDIGAGLAATSDVSGLTLANLATSSSVTAGTFTVNGKTVTIALTDSLQDVFDAISTATGGAVTGTYDPATDRVSLTRASGELVLGAGNDTSNFLAVMRLANNGTAATTSAAALGAVKTTATLASGGLRSAITAVDGTGAGSFSINGVAIAYNINTDTLNSVINRINASAAGVTAAYDATKDRVVLTNRSTGDMGFSVEEASDGLVDALGLSSAKGASIERGKNAEFTVNGGAVISSASNTLDKTAHGIDGLSVTVNTATEQILQVESDTIAMQGAIEKFIEKFNAVQDYIEESTKLSVDGTSVSSSVLSSNREIQDWASQLRKLAFDAVSGVSGDVARMSDLGIDFDGTSGHLKVKNSGKLATALGDTPADVESFFLKPTTGIVGRFYSYLTKIGASERKQAAAFVADNTALDDQIATLQTRLDQEREQLTNAFLRMLDAQSNAQNQNTYLTNTFFKNNSNN